MGYKERQVLTAKDSEGDEVELSLTGVHDDSLRIQEANSRLLNEILLCQKKIVTHLQLLTEVEINDHNIEK